MILVKNQFSCFDAYTRVISDSLILIQTFWNSLLSIASFSLVCSICSLKLNLSSFANPQMHTPSSINSWHDSRSLLVVRFPPEDPTHVLPISFRNVFSCYFDDSTLWKTIRRIWRRKISNSTYSWMKNFFSAVWFCLGFFRYPRIFWVFYVVVVVILRRRRCLQKMKFNICFFSLPFLYISVLTHSSIQLPPDCSD